MESIKEIYISVDIEATGPIPGKYSMSSIGAFAAGALLKDGSYIKFDHEDSSKVFYKELKPISPDFIEEAIKVGVLDGYEDHLLEKGLPDTGGFRHSWMQSHGVDPREAMLEFSEWCKNISEEHNAAVVFTAYPLSFDWMFVYWYLVNFDVESPFGFSRTLDVKSLFMAKSKKPLINSTKRYMPKNLFSKLPHTHRADDDAIEQGILAMNILNWVGR